MHALPTKKTIQKQNLFETNRDPNSKNAILSPFTANVLAC